MEAYNSFIYSISKYPIIELDEIITAGQVGFRLNIDGSNLERTIQICSNLRVLASDFLDKLPLATKGPQTEIRLDYDQLRSINSLLKQNICKHDEVFPTMQCGPHFNKIVEILNDIEQYIPLLASNQSSSIDQYLDGLISNIVNVIDLYDKIIELAKNCENELRPKISPLPDDELHISLLVAASLATFEELLIKLHFFILNKTVQSSEKIQNLNEWIEKGEKLRQNLFETTISDENQIFDVSSSILSKLSSLSSIISEMPQSISNSIEFSNISVSLTNLIQILNQIESKITVKNITQIIENLPTLFSSNESLDNLIQNTKEVIEKVGIQIDKSVILSSSFFIVSSYLSLSKCIEKCTTNKSGDHEFVLLCAASVARLAARVFPDAKIGEEILVSLSQKVATITKSIFNECKDLIARASSIIGSNLESINDSALCETNYFITTAKNVEDFDLDSDDFVSTQQTFFASFCALPVSLTKLASTCINENAKDNLNKLIESIQNVGDRFAKWLNQFWLTVFSVVHIRSEMILGALSFPLSLLLNTDKNEELKNIKTCLSKIEKINKSTPQILMGDIDEVNSIISIIFDISKSVDYYMTSIGSNAQSQIFPLYKMSSDALSEIILDLPQFGLQLPLVGNVDNIDDFVCFMLAFTTCSFRLSNSFKELTVDEEAFEVIQEISPSFTYVYFTDYFISQFAQTPYILPPLIANLHVSMDILISNLTRIILGNKVKENEEKNLPSLPDSFQSYIKAIETFLSEVYQLKQPSIAYDIPDDVQEIRRFESVTSSLHSQSLKTFAKFVLMTLKDSQSFDVRNLLKKWFDTTQMGTVSISKSGEDVKLEIKNLLNNSKADRSAFIQRFSTFSVSLATKESKFNKTISPIVVDLHQNIVTKVAEFLQETKETTEILLNLFGAISEIIVILPISKLKEKKDKDQYISSILKSVIVSLNVIRQKNDKSIELDDKLNAIESIKKLCAFNIIFNSSDDLDLNNLLEKVVKGEFDGEFLNLNISKFSEILIPLIPNQFSLLDSIQDNDTACDFLYDKAEAFGENVNAIMQLAKNHEGDDRKISESLNTMYLSSSDASLLVMHSLHLNGIDKTPLCATFVICCCELIIGIRKLSDCALSITTRDTEEGCLPELRKVNRKLSAQFDSFINIVEDPQTQSDDMTDYEQKKCELYLNVASTVLQVDRLIALTATSLVPEMYFKTRDQIASQIEESLSRLQLSITDVLDQTVSTDKEHFMSLFTHLQQESASLLECSKNLTFDTLLVPLKLIQSCDQFCSFAKKIATTGQLLTDKIIIQPDPVAASRVPDEALLPVFPKEAPPVAESFKLLEISHKKMEEVLTEFKKVNDDELSKSDELIESIQKLREASDDFIDKSILMAVSTVNPLYQVEQQTSLHVFVNALNNVQSAMRSRLMRTKSFKTEMDDSLSAFEFSVSKTIKLASSSSSSSSSQAQKEDENLDDVTRELNATAKVIEMMSARLKEFEHQVNMEVLNSGDKENEDVFDPEKASQIEDIQAAAETLPAYLIAAADPILASTTQILGRAKEVTSWLLKKFGKIENERGLINTAQNLSEAAELLLVCAEILVSGQDKSAEFKAITAARIINSAVIDLQVQILKKGGDNEGIIQKYINIVKKYSNSIVLRGEAIVAEKLNQSYEKRPKKKLIFQRKLEQDDVVANLRTKLESEEKALKEFRYQQHRNYHSPLKEKKT